MELTAEQFAAATADTFTLALAAAAQTGCPVHDWCATDHDGHGEDGDYHYGAQAQAGPYRHALEITPDGTPVVALAGGAYERLDADETDALLAALSAHRERMAALAAQMTAQVAR